MNLDIKKLINEINKNKNYNIKIDDPITKKRYYLTLQT